MGSQQSFCLDWECVLDVAHSRTTIKLTVAIAWETLSLALEVSCCRGDLAFGLLGQPRLLTMAEYCHIVVWCNGLNC